MKNNLLQLKLKYPWLAGFLSVKSIVSTVGFLLIWWQLLVFAAHGQPLIGCLISQIYIVFHLLVTAQSRWVKELQFILLFGCLGWLGDGLLIHLKILDFQGAAVAPLWVLMMWMNYMTSIHYSMATMYKSLSMSLFVGFIYGPWTYLACYKLGLVQFPVSVTLSALIQGLIWMVWMYIYRYICLRQLF